MPSPATGRTVVVAYDGSRASRVAVDHALVRAGADGRLIVVHAFRSPPDTIGAPGYGAALGRSTMTTAALIDRLERDCGGLHEVDYEADVLEGRPAEVVCRVAESRDADEIVIGSRGAGRVRALLGSVAHEVLHRARCPVIVIPERMTRAQPAPIGNAVAAPL